MKTSTAIAGPDVVIQPDYSLRSRSLSYYADSTSPRRYNDNQINSLRILKTPSFASCHSRVESFACQFVNSSQSFSFLLSLLSCFYFFNYLFFLSLLSLPSSGSFFCFKIFFLIFLSS